MYTVTFSAAAIFTLGVVFGLISGTIVLVAVAISLNNKKKK